MPVATPGPQNCVLFETDAAGRLDWLNESQQYNEFIEEMPLVDKPGVFGLHGNADIAYQTQVAQATLTNTLDIHVQPKGGGGGDGGESREEAVTRMCNDFLEKLPDDFVQHEYTSRLKKMGVNTSMNIFLRQRN